jgi:methionyl-tRNA formyltransferase
MKSIVIATVKSWNIANAENFKAKYGKEWDIHIVTDKDALTYEALSAIGPRYVFFPHWSWIIPREIHENFECIVFHMTDLPYGRGGSPLQNLILNKVKKTKISALRVEKGLDTGGIYLKEDLFIGEGSADEIFRGVSDKIFGHMIPFILFHHPAPQKQEGAVVEFKRRKPEQSNLGQAGLTDLDSAYDFIRMLDAEGYPKAFLKTNALKIEFSGIHKKDGKLTGRFEITHEE